jgi:hypothetical protein
MSAVFNTILFDFHRDRKLFTTDVSVLSHHAPQVFHELRKGEHGFMLESHKTGKQAEFIVTHVDTSDGEIQGWNMEPTAEAVRRNEALRGVKLLVVNT